MKIFTKARYALRFMVDLAVNENNGFIPLKDISERQEISIKYLEQIVTQLSKNGLIVSQRGQQGGHKLAKPSDSCTAGDILRAIEGNLAPVTCLEQAPNQCPRKDKCSTLSFWGGFANVINSYVDSVTLKDLAENFEKNCCLNFNI